MRIHEHIAASNARRRRGHGHLCLMCCERLSDRIEGPRAASQNTQAALSFVQTAEGGLHEVHATMQRMRQHTFTAGNLGVGDGLALRALQTEIGAHVAELDRIIAETRFGTVHLLDGRFATYPAVFQIGAGPSRRLEVRMGALDAAALGVHDLDVTSRDPADVDAARHALDAAIATTSRSRVALGASVNRLRDTVRGLGTAIENLRSAESRIGDTDLPLASIERACNVVMIQTGRLMLVHARRVPDTVFELLGLPPQPPGTTPPRSHPHHPQIPARSPSETDPPPTA